MCVFVCNTINIHVCVCVCMYVHIQVCIHTCIHTCIYTYVYTCMHVCMYLCMCRYSGQVGYVILGMRSVKEAHVGDTFHSSRAESVTPLPGFKPMKPMVSTYNIVVIITNLTTYITVQLRLHGRMY